MLKLMNKTIECGDCDYWYEKGSIAGCIFPNHIPIVTMPECDCTKGKDCGVEIDEDHVQIRNIKELAIL